MVRTNKTAERSIYEEVSPSFMVNVIFLNFVKKRKNVLTDPLTIKTIAQLGGS